MTSQKSITSKSRRIGIIVGHSCRWRSQLRELPQATNLSNTLSKEAYLIIAIVVAEIDVRQCPRSSPALKINSLEAKVDIRLKSVTSLPTLIVKAPVKKIKTQMTDLLSEAEITLSQTSYLVVSTKKRTSAALSKLSIHWILPMIQPRVSLEKPNFLATRSAQLTSLSSLSQTKWSITQMKS